MADATRSIRAPRRAAAGPAVSRRGSTPTSRGTSRPSGTGTSTGTRTGTSSGSRRSAPDHPTNRRRSRVALGLLTGVIVAAIVGALVVLPVRTWLAQRDELEAKQDELATLERVNEGLADDIARLQTPEGIEDAARLELGYRMAGETQVATSELPDAPVELPGGWPYTMVTQILAVRRGGG